MRMSCNGCRVLRKGCSEDCSIRPCLQWIKNPESQANATVFLAKFYGRAGLMNLINAAPQHHRPAIFRSLLYEACGRIVNPIYGSVGLLWSGSWQLCQAAVEAVLKGEPITPITSEAAANGRGPPLKAYDIRHVSKDENSTGLNEATQRAKSRPRLKRTGTTVVKPKTLKGARTGLDELETANRTTSHGSSLSHVAEGESKESESVVSVETSILFHDEPESTVKARDQADESGSEIGLELTLGFEPVSRDDHVVPLKKRRIELMSCCGSAENGSCKTELGLEYSA
ncbi:LOB domain-containing protein 41-like [Abrus precatorius]|uniref:LOB domain-containing protein 41-like n=1 Tax=Abrus precatorius TaxID=3816 RepID=A0A8B8LUQ8_ABRPR|nr:LOB domain-containing protein 41-like [Abrus precatorius]